MKVISGLIILETNAINEGACDLVIVHFLFVAFWNQSATA